MESLSKHIIGLVLRCHVIVTVFQVESAILLNMVKTDSTATIQCSGNTEITFQLISGLQNETINIAECETRVHSCSLMDVKYAKYYNVSHTSSGGLLFIIRLNKDTYGTYKCVATYNFSISASVDVLNVHKVEPPGIVIRKMESGSTAAIECSGNTEITFQFISIQKNETIIIAECETRIQSCSLMNMKYAEYYNASHTGSGGLLFIIRLNKVTYGTYKCVATYNASVSASVDVLNVQKEEPPGIIMRKMESGSTATIECSGNTEITFQFIRTLKNETINIAECETRVQSCSLMDVKYSEYYNVSHTGSGGILFIIRLNKDTYGTYKCVATYNSSISASVDVLNVQKEEPPGIIMRKMESGSTATIKCSGNTEITFQFIRTLKNETITMAECETRVQSCKLMDVKYSEYYKISHTGSGGILFIIRLNKETYGTYKCVATYNSSISASVDVLNVSATAVNTDNVIEGNTLRNYGISIGIFASIMFVLPITYVRKKQRVAS